MSLVSIVVILVLLLGTALYVAAEFAAVGVRRSRIRQLAEDGHRAAIGLLPILESPQRLDRYIAASQVGITLSSLVLGAYGQATIAPGFAAMLRASFEIDAGSAYSWASFAVLVVLTLLGMLVGELVPKSLALQYPATVAMYTYWPMRWSLAAAGWFIDFLNNTGLVVLRVLRAPHAAHRHIHAPEEIEMLIAESRDGGLLEPDEHQRLQRALRISLRTARQLMVPRERVVALDAALPYEELFERAVATPYQRIPVYEGTLDNVIGLLNVKHLVLRELEGRPISNIREILRPPLAVNEQLTGDRLIALLRARRAHQAIVQDGEGRMVGIVVLEHLLGELLRPRTGTPSTATAKA
jgi:putative hemolysin